MTDCLPDLLTILADPDEPEDLKTYVLAALRDMGTADRHRQAWDILRAAPALTNQMRSVACETLYPDTFETADIALLLEKPDLRDEHSGSLQHGLQQLLEEHLTPECAAPMIVDRELPFDTISDADVRLITRYAVQEMNGFPTWLQDLTNARPVPVAEVLTACVLGEWQYPATRDRYNDVLAGVAWVGSCLAQLVRSFGSFGREAPWWWNRAG